MRPSRLAVTAAVRTPVGLWNGASESMTVVKASLADLVSGGLAAQDGLLIVMDGSRSVPQARPRGSSAPPHHNGMITTVTLVASGPRLQ